MIEIKVPDSNNYFRQILGLTAGTIVPHYFQMQFNMFVCGRSWCDYVLYNPKHEARGKSLYIHRVEYNVHGEEGLEIILNGAIDKIQEYVNAYQALI